MAYGTTVVVYELEYVLCVVSAWYAFLRVFRVYIFITCFFFFTLFLFIYLFFFLAGR